MNQLAVDLYCGLGGWAEGFLAEDYDVIGFDIERHDYGTGGYPGQLVLQDVTTLHGSRFKDAAVILASPPCQKYSYMAMPWKRAKALAAWYREPGHPERIVELNALFNACFRIQREVIEAAGRHIPLIIENVRGAQPWVGRSAWKFGSYHLWGDVPALMPIPYKAQKFNPDGTAHPPGSWFAIADSQNRGIKAGDRCLDKETGRWSTGWNAANARAWREVVKQAGIAGTRTNGKGSRWFQDGAARHSSKYDSRKAASAQIAKIPFPLARHIAKCFKQERVSCR